MMTYPTQKKEDLDMASDLLPLPTIMESILADVRLFAPNIELRCFTDPGAEQGHVRDAFLHQPLYEVLLNAVRAAREGGLLSKPHVLVMAVIMEDNWVEIHVDDGGKGFALPFETACMAGVSMWEDGVRMGLGLPTAMSMLEMIGGTLQQTTGYLGGARVTLRLPLHPAPKPTDAAPTNP